MSILMFDVDGVVLQPPCLFSEHLVREHGATPEELEDFFLHGFQACLLGEADLLEMLPPLLPRWNWKGTLPELIDAWFRAEYIPNAPLLETVQLLRVQGFSCFLATNQEVHRATALWERLQGHFDGMFASSAIKARKPQPQYFERVTARICSQDIFFWDDQPKNVEAARQAGWKAQLYTTPQAVLEVLQSR